MMEPKWIATNGGKKTWLIGQVGGSIAFTVTCRWGNRANPENIRDMQKMLDGLNAAKEIPNA